MKAIILAAGILLRMATTSFAADSVAPAADAINSLGIDLLRQTGKADANALLSPYSIETALVMTYAGADGVTRDEMAKVLHLTNDEGAVHSSFGLLQRQITGMMQRSAQSSARWRQEGLTNDPITLTVANRLFGQQGFAIHDNFLKRLNATYDAPLQLLDFKRNPGGAAKSINDWVEQQTKHRIQNSIPEHGLTPDVRMVLVNAIYLKAPWEEPFWKNGTKPRPFQVPGGTPADTLTMKTQRQLGYAKFNGFTAVSIPYKGSELQFLILLPDATNGLVDLEGKVVHLAKCANLPEREVLLYLPKFELTPPAMPLADGLTRLGMTTAFDSRANFGRITAEKPFYIFDVFHKAFLSLDEEGTEAAAATEVVMAAGIPPPPPKPIEVRVDHPFVFAIQHRASGACLFLGHVVDPR
jgi:serpin B